jgi:NADH dehydrogenase FAD-containing subunit
MKRDRHKIVVIGGGYVGTLAAVRVAGRSRQRGEVTLIDPDGTLVQRLRLHQVATGERVAAPELAKLCGRRVEQVRGWAESIELDKGVVRVRGVGDASIETVPYDSLIVGHRLHREHEGRPRRRRARAHAVGCRVLGAARR